MDLAEALLARLSAATSVTDIAAERLYWGVRPQGSALPALVMRQVSSVPEETLAGEDPDLWTTRIQLEAMARSHAEAWALAKAASSTLLPAVVVGTDPQSIEFELGERLGPRDLGEADEKGFVHQAVTDMIFRHSAGS
jgi:hypothetical protein